MAHSRRLALAALMASALGLAGLAGCSRERVPLPAADASPQEVVRAYIDAVNAGDCDSAAALSEPARSHQVWCDGDVTLTNVRVDSPREDGCCGVSETFAQSRLVPVVFDRRGGEVSFPDERDAPWSYILVRDSDAERWRVADQGLG